MGDKTMIACDRCKMEIDESGSSTEEEIFFNKMLKENEEGDYCFKCSNNALKYLKGLLETITPGELKEYQELKEREKVAQREKENKLMGNPINLNEELKK
jgi:hypothetical protein